MDDRYDPNLILAYVEDELDEQQRADFEARFENDTALRDLVEQLAQDRVALRALPRDEPATSPADAAIAVMERDLLLGDTPGPEPIVAGTIGTPERQYTLLRWLTYGSVAAALALTGAVVVMTLTDTPLDDRAEQLAATDPDAPGWDADLAERDDLTDFDSLGDNVKSQPTADDATLAMVDRLAALESDGDVSTDEILSPELSKSDASTLFADSHSDKRLAGGFSPPADRPAERFDLAAAGRTNARGIVGTTPPPGVEDSRLGYAEDAATDGATADAASPAMSESLAIYGLDTRTREPDPFVNTTHLAGNVAGPPTYTPAAPPVNYYTVAAERPVYSQRQLAAWVVSNGGTVLNTVAFAEEAEVESHRLGAALADENGQTEPVVLGAKLDPVAAKASGSGEQPIRAQQLDVLVPSDKFDDLMAQVPAARAVPEPRGQVLVTRGRNAVEFNPRLPHADPSPRRQPRTAEANTPASSLDDAMRLKRGASVVTADAEDAEIAADQSPPAETPLLRFGDGRADADIADLVAEESLQDALGERSRDRAFSSTNETMARESFFQSEGEAQRRLAQGFGGRAIAVPNAPLGVEEPSSVRDVARNIFGDDTTDGVAENPMGPALGRGAGVPAQWTAGYWFTNTTAPPAIGQVRVILELTPAQPATAGPDASN